MDSSLDAGLRTSTSGCHGEAGPPAWQIHDRVDVQKCGAAATMVLAALLLTCQAGLALTASSAVGKRFLPATGSGLHKAPTQIVLSDRAAPKAVVRLSSSGGSRPSPVAGSPCPFNRDVSALPSDPCVIAEPLQSESLLIQTYECLNKPSARLPEKLKPPSTGTEVLHMFWLYITCTLCRSRRLIHATCCGLAQ